MIRYQTRLLEQHSAHTATARRYLLQDIEQSQPHIIRELIFSFCPKSNTLEGRGNEGSTQKNWNKVLS